MFESKQTPEDVAGSRRPATEEGAPPRKPLQELQQAISYRFRNEDYLINALVHKSYLHEVPDTALGSNERLEFLGDSVLGFIVSGDLFKSRPGMSEGELSSLRGVLVRLSTLAELAIPLHLGEYLYMSHGEEAAGGRTRDTNLGRAVEALLGAVYMDGGLEATQAVWHCILGERSIEQMQQVLQADYKSRLQQFTQAHLRATPQYRIVSTSGPDHAKQFEVEVRAGERTLAVGEGRNKQLAEQQAAEKALSSLESELPQESDALDQGDQAAGRGEEMAQP